jgi:hypothetical protein
VAHAVLVKRPTGALPGSHHALQKHNEQAVKGREARRRFRGPSNGEWPNRNLRTIIPAAYRTGQRSSGACTHPQAAPVVHQGRALCPRQGLAH